MREGGEEGPMGETWSTEPFFRLARLHFRLGRLSECGWMHCASVCQAWLVLSSLSLRPATAHSKCENKVKRKKMFPARESNPDLSRTLNALQAYESAIY